MTKNNHRSQVPAEDIIEMYTNQKMNIIEISQHTNKCCEVIRKILREHNIPIKTHPASRQVRCIELDIVYDSITLMADFLIQSQYLNDTTAHTAASAIGQSIRHPEQYDGYKGYHFEFIE